MLPAPTGRPLVDEHPSGFGWRYQWVTVFGTVELRYERHLAQALYLAGLATRKMHHEPLKAA